MNSLDALPVRTLMRIARQSLPEKEPGCALLLELFSSVASLHAALDDFLRASGLDSHKFAALLALYALDPVPAAPADLAFHVRTGHRTMAVVLEHLAAHDWIVLPHDGGDGRPGYVTLTRAGREITADTIRRLLALASGLFDRLDASARETLASTCRFLREQADPAFAPPASALPR